METKVYTKEGKESGKVKLPESIFGLPWNGDLVHQVITSIRSAQRVPVAHAKDRSEVRGGGAKPWRQKGTGRARHGSSRSPIWKGGGVTHGPRNEKNYDRKVNKKMKTKALFTLLSKKMKDGEVVFVDSLTLDEAKTAKAKSVFDSLAKVKGYEALGDRRKNRALIGSAEKNEVAMRAFQNFSNVKFDELRNLNPVDVANYKFIVIENPAESLKVLEARAK